MYARAQKRELRGVARVLEREVERERRKDQRNCELSKTKIEQVRKTETITYLSGIIFRNQIVQ